MRKVFISFVGTGSPTKTPGYDNLAYRWIDGKEFTTRFAQRAIIEALTPAFFDRIVLLMTEANNGASHGVSTPVVSR